MLRRLAASPASHASRLSSSSLFARTAAPPARTAVLARPPASRIPLPLPCRTFASTHPAQAATMAPLVPFRTHTPAPTAPPSTPLVHTFYHDPTATWTYVLVCPRTRACAIVDSALDYDPSTQRISTESADGLLAFLEHEQYKVVRILETHAHADHLTAARYLQMRLSPDGAPPVPIGIHRGIRTTQAHFGALYDVPDAELERAFDELYDEGDKLEVGELKGEVWHLPGHTQCSAGFVFGESVFTGDSVLLPPTGTARADFPSGSASALYASASRLLSLPPHYRLFSGHSYPQSGASNVCSATVAQQRELNPHVKSGTGEDDFVRMRSERDKGLAEPRLLHQSLQVNIRGGRLPRGSNGEAYLRLPLRAPKGL